MKVSVGVARSSRVKSKLLVRLIPVRPSVPTIMRLVFVS